MHVDCGGVKLQKKLIICLFAVIFLLSSCTSFFMSDEEKERNEIVSILQDSYAPKYERAIANLNGIANIEDFFDYIRKSNVLLSFNAQFHIYEPSNKLINVSYRDFPSYGMKDYGTEFLTASRNKLKQLGYGDILTVSFSESGRPEIAWDMEIVREAIKSDDLTSIIKRVNQFERIYNNEYWFYSPQNKTPFDFAENAFTVFLRAQKSKLIKEGKVNRNLNVAYDYCKTLEEKYNLDDLYINNYNPWFSARNVFLADVREEIQNGISVSDDEISDYLLKVVQQNIEVNDFVEAYDILSYLIQSSKSNQNPDVISAYKSFIEENSDNLEFQENVLTRDYSIFRNWDNLYGFKDSNGEIVIEPIFYSVTRFHNGLAFAQTFPDRIPCFIDSRGNIVISFDREDSYFYNLYDDERYAMPVLAPFNEGVCMIATDDGITYIDKDGNIDYTFLEKTKQNDIEVTGRIFSNGLICARDLNTGYYGYLDKNGDWAISPKYSYAYDFMQDGIAFVSYNIYGDGLAIIDVDGNSTVPFDFEDYSINDGVAILEDYTLAAILNLKTGDILYYPVNYLKVNPDAWEISYDTIDYSKLRMNEGLFVTCTRYKTGVYSNDPTVKINISIVNADGTVIASFDEDEEIASIMPFKNGKMRVTLVSGESYSVDYFGDVFVE